MLTPLLSVYNRCDISFPSGKGCYLTDQNGKEYLDFGAGIAVMSLGYRHPKLVNCLKNTASLPWHVSNAYQIPGQTTLATKLIADTNLDNVFFCNSGTEATETAIKIIRKYFNSKTKDNKKNEIITFEHAFHGRTIAAISAGGSEKYKDGYEPLLEKFTHIPLENLSIEKVAERINENTAAILLEPIQGEGGIYEFKPEFLKDLQALCQKHEIILVFDEVQCGMGRTGKKFHYQWHDLDPDIVFTAKGIGGGFPLAACLVKEKYGKAMTLGSHGGTFGGNPLAMAVGNTVLDEILTPQFLEKVVKHGNYFKSQLSNIQKLFPKIISEVRGEGLMLGIKINGDHYKIVSDLRDRGLLTIPASNEVIRFLPPLIIKKKDIDLGIKLIKESLASYS